MNTREEGRGIKEEKGGNFIELEFREAFTYSSEGNVTNQIEWNAKFERTDEDLLLLFFAIDR